MKSTTSSSFTRQRVYPERHTPSGYSSVSEKAKSRQVGMQMNIKGVFLHLLADALGSIIVVVSALFLVFAPESEYSDFVDPTLSMVLVLLISCSVWPLFKASAYILMQTVPSHINVREMHDHLLRAIPHVHDIHDFHVWELVASRVIASVHVRMNKRASTRKHMQYAENIKTFFHDHGIHITTIQMEYARDGDHLHTTACSLRCPTNEASRGTSTAKPFHDRSKSPASKSKIKRSLIKRDKSDVDLLSKVSQGSITSIARVKSSKAKISRRSIGKSSFSKWLKQKRRLRSGTSEDRMKRRKLLRDFL